MPNDYILEVKNLSVHFGSLKAVDDISFKVRRGEVYGIVGESGCGKTTTGRAIIKLYEPTGGEVYLDGICISSTSKTNYTKVYRSTKIEELKKEYQGRNDEKSQAELKYKLKIVKKMNPITQIQMIFQDPIASLDPRMTVRDIIAEGLIIGGHTNRSEIDEMVYEVLESVGLVRENAQRYPHEFSGGQRQRIGIARAIIMKPKIIIADEPVSALDVSIQAQVITILNNLRKTLGLTIVFIAHDISVVKYVSDRIAVMYYGKIVEEAGSDELFTNPLHPYTRSLFSAIPFPDPLYEKKRTRITYNPVTAHDYSTEKPEMREIVPGHFVFCNSAEFGQYAKEMETGND